MSEDPGDGDGARRATEDAEALAAELGQRLAKGQARADAVAARRLRYLEGGLGLVIFVAFLGRWVQAELLEPRAARADAGAAVVEQMARTEESVLILGGAVAIGLAVLAWLAWSATQLPGEGGLLSRLRAWWSVRAERLRAGPSLALFLVAFGATVVAQALMLPLLPTATLVVEGPQARRVKVPLTGLALEPGGGLDVPGLPKGRLGIAPAGEGARLLDKEWGRRAAAHQEPPPPLPVPVAVGGVAFVGSQAELPDGARFEVGGLRLQVEGVGPDGRRDRIALGTLGGALGALLIALGALRFGGVAALRSVGLVPDGLAGELRRGLLGGLALLPVYAACMLAWTAVGKLVGAPLQSHQLIDELGRSTASGLWVIVALNATVVAPIGEELLFRGFLLPGYARVIGPAGAIVASSLVFGALHMSFLSLLPIGLVGATCGALTATSPARSLVGSMVAHALFNGLQLAAAFVALSG